MAYPYYQNQYYYPAGYQPVQPVMQQPQQPMQQSYSQPQQSYAQPIASNGIMWVDDEREAAMFPIAPNNAVALWEKSGKRAFMKKADATGKPTMTVYDLVERPDTAKDGGNGADSKQAAYATKEELGAVLGVVKEIDGIIASMKSDIETMRGDLYGVAGRKKSVKKAEGEDDT